MKTVQRAALGALALASPAWAQTIAAAQVDSGIVEIVGGRPSSLPTHLPTTIESVTADDIALTINATDSEDALKYLPSLLVRKRYIGDYNHAVLSSRASGTGNSARSMVFADGILLSNYLGNGASFTPRWGLVSPEEIERVDVLYGPFSAVYSGNSVGAVVDYVTRMPARFEAHAKVGTFVQPFELYGTHDTYRGWQTSASLGSRSGDWSWWLSASRLDSEGQPLTFPTRLPTQAVARPGTPVTGAVAGRDKSGADWWLLGSATQYRTVQDQAKLKLAYEFAPGVRATYVFGLWRNATAGQAESWLRSSAGDPVYGGTVNIGGRDYALAASDFAPSRDGQRHLMHGLTVQSRTRGVFDWKLSASLYDYDRDLQRVPTVARPAADDGGAGRVTDLGGSGWDTLAFDAVWRPGGAHQIEFGLQQEQYRWRQAIRSVGDWLGDSGGTALSAFSGNTRLRSVYAQDAWTMSPVWKALIGGRFEHWQAWDGRKSGVAGTPPALFDDRSESHFSPKFALGFQPEPDWSVKLSTGRAVRMPTVGELFQGTPGDNPPINDPSLKPERSWTTELSSTWSIGMNRVRASLFHEDTRDALYAQAIAGTTPLVSSTQNVGRIRTRGMEAVFEGVDVAVKGVDLLASLTYADSRIVENDAFPASVGKRQPRVPRWRASLLATWHATRQLTASFGARYGSTQFGTLDNSDRNGFAYQGFSRYFTTDLRLHYAIDKQWSAAFGIDNLNNAHYWNFHPYPQRTYSAELKFDL